MPSIQELGLSETVPVLVTGGTGYLAGVLIKQLLERGLLVHATVRGIDDSNRFQYLYDVAAQTAGKLRLFEADLTIPNSFDDAAKGCSVIFHTASPFALKVDNPQKDLIDPAVKGTENVLMTANRTPTIRRIVLTSSSGAIYSDAADLRETPLGVFDEKVWNTTCSLRYCPYFYSKTLAEKRAWELSKEQSQWTLVVMNPTLIMGPGLKYHATSESYKLLLQLGGGDMKGGAPNLPYGVVDVRDVATAHVAAAFLPNAQGRYLLSGTDSSFPEMCCAIAQKYGPPTYPVPLKPLQVPKLVMWFLAPYVSPLTRKFMWRNLNYIKKFDSSKSKLELELAYRPLEETMQDMYAQLLDLGIVKPVKNSASSSPSRIDEWKC